MAPLQSMKIILASTSPRRQELLSRLNIPFEVHAPKFDETSDPTLTAEQEALSFARAKALSLKNEFPNALIIGSDTIVEIDGKKLGKPRDVQEAAAMLRRLSGRLHRVLTALAVVDPRTGEIRESLSVAQVEMKPLKGEEIHGYIATGEPFDKAGAYAVQGIGGNLVAQVIGDYDTVVGLPLKELRRLLDSMEHQ